MRQDRFVDWRTSQTEFEGRKFVPAFRSGRWAEISGTSPSVMLANGDLVTVGRSSGDGYLLIEAAASPNGAQ